MISSTIAGSIVGLLGSAMGPIADYFTQKANAKFELEKMEKAAELKKLGFEQEQVMYAITARDKEHERLLEHDIAISKGTGFIGGLQKSVRPIITYSFFLLFAAVEVSILIEVVNSGEDILTAIDHVWDEETSAIFSSIIMFWFGNRFFEKLKGIA